MASLTALREPPRCGAYTRDCITVAAQHRDIGPLHWCCGLEPGHEGDHSCTIGRATVTWDDSYCGSLP